MDIELSESAVGDWGRRLLLFPGDYYGLVEAGI